MLADIDTSQTLHQNAEVVEFFGRLIEEVRSLPGVRSAAASIVVPLGGRTWTRDYEIRDRALLPGSFENWVTPEYFATLGTPLLLGRSFGRDDSAKAGHVAIVNQAFAQRAFGRTNPIGRQIYEKDKKDAITIVGVVTNARYQSLRDPAPPTIYRPIEQLPDTFGFLLTLNLEVWTAAPATDLRLPIEQLVKRLESRAITEFRTFDSLIDSNLAYERLLTALSMGFGLIGLFLAITGVYGLSSYSVARRTSEFGIRMALGASPHSILTLVCSEQMRLLSVAVLAGLLLSFATTRFLKTWLFGVSPLDPVIFSVSVIFITSLALTAALVPARRAAHLNPVIALRHE